MLGWARVIYCVARWLGISVGALCLCLCALAPRVNMPAGPRHRTMTKVFLRFLPYTTTLATANNNCLQRIAQIGCPPVTHYDESVP